MVKMSFSTKFFIFISFIICICYTTSLGEMLITEKARNETLVEGLAWYDICSRSFKRSRTQVQKYLSESFGFDFGVEIKAIAMQKYFDEKIELVQLMYKQAELDFDELYHQLLMKKQEKDMFLELLKRRINENDLYGVQQDIIIEKRERNAVRNLIKDDLNKMLSKKKEKLDEMKNQEKEKSGLTKQFKNKLNECEKLNKEIHQLQMDKQKLEIELNDIEKQMKNDKKLEKSVKSKKEEIEKKQNLLKEKTNKYDNIKNEFDSLVKKICNEDENMLKVYEKVIETMINQDKMNEKCESNNKSLKEQMKVLKGERDKTKSNLRTQERQNDKLRKEVNKIPTVKNYHIHTHHNDNNYNNNNDNMEYAKLQVVYDFAKSCWNWGKGLVTGNDSTQTTTTGYLPK